MFPTEHGMWRIHISLSAGEVSNLCAEQRGAQLSHILPDVRRCARRPAPETQTDGAGSVQCKFVYHLSNDQHCLHFLPACNNIWSLCCKLVQYLMDKYICISMKPEQFKCSLKTVVNSKASFTRNVNVTVFVSGTFDLFESHFHGLNGYTTHFAY